MALLPSGVMFGWKGTHAGIPAGAPRATGYDGRFVKMIATSGTNPGATGGASSHGHGSVPNHSHALGGHTHATGSTNAIAGGGAVTANAGTDLSLAHETHSHGTTPGPASNTTAAAGGNACYSSASTAPAWVEVIILKSDGSTLTGFPNGALAFFNGAAPSGWTAYANGDNRLWKAPATGGDGGGTGGTGSSHTHSAAGSHTHALPAHTHTTTVTGGATKARGSHAFCPCCWSSQLTMSAGSHTHSVANSGSGGAVCSGSASPASAAGDVTPPWYKLRVIENTSGGVSWPNGIIAMWEGTIASIPTAFYLCDGTNGTPNLSNAKYVMGMSSSGSVGDTGGAATHSHTGANHTHTGGAGHTHSGCLSVGAASGTVTTYYNGTNDGATTNHTHFINGALGSAAAGTLTCAAAGASATAANDQLYTAVAYIQFLNTTPDVPSITSPADGAAYDGTIQLAATVNDPDGDDVHAVFEWRKAAGSWTVIGDGTTVTGSGTSTRPWNIAAFGPGVDYEVRAKAVDQNSAESAYDTTAEFTIHHFGLLALIPA